MRRTRQTIALHAREPEPAAFDDESIPSRFERQAAARGGYLAVKSSQREATYEELNAEANRIARAIQSAGAVQGEPVALLLELGATAVAAIFGVLKAGSPYVPIDTSYPAPRIAHILADSGARVVLTDDACERILGVLSPAPDHLGPTVLNLDHLDPSLSPENPGLAVAPGDDAFVIYTSGSTGSPKGVCHSHRSLLHHVVNHINYLRIGADDRLTMLNSHAYGGSLSDVFSALLAGAALFPYDINREGLGGIAPWVRRNGITVYNSVPTLFRHLCAAPHDGSDLASLRAISLVGEPAYSGDLDLLRSHLPRGCQLVNRYSSTESLTARCFFADADTEVADGLLPVGYWIADVEVLLLDDEGRQVGAGEAGQIAVRSAYLAKGYWNNPELTGEVFLACPNDPSKRIYLTGDVGRMESDGRMLHLGRRDSQVKIRGYRVETAEVEMALLGLPQVREAVVVQRPDLRGERGLVAYVVANSAASVTEASLRAQLAQKLPTYMLPSSYVLLEALPLSPNGKVDRKALPVPASRVTREIVAPRDALERRLVGIWEAMLGVESIGIADRFFEIGGHSLLAARLFAEVERQLGRRLPLSILMEGDTVEHMANLLRAEGGALNWSSLVPLKPSGGPPLFCVHPIDGSVLHYRHLVGHLNTEQPAYGLQARIVDGAEAVQASVEQMAADYVREIRSLQPEGPYHLVGYSAGGVIAFEMAQQIGRQGQEAGLLAMLDTRCPNPADAAVLKAEARRHLGALRDEAGADRLGYLKGVALGAAKRLRSRLLRLTERFRRPQEESGSAMGLDTTEALRRLIRSYVAKPYSGKIVLFRATSTQEERHDDAYLGWHGLASQIEVCEASGSHADLLAPENAAGVAELLEARLDESRGARV